MSGLTYKSQYIAGKKEKFVRLDDTDSTVSLMSTTNRMKKCGFSLRDLTRNRHSRYNASKSFRHGVKRGSQEMKSLGKSFRSRVMDALCPEELKVSERFIYDPQDKSLLLWNRIFLVSCIVAVSVDPLFLYLPVFNDASYCLNILLDLAKTCTTLRTIIDLFFLGRIFFKFRTAYVAPSSRVFGRGELVTDSRKIAKRYMHRYFIVDFLSVLPLPQATVWKFLSQIKQRKAAEVFETKQSLLWVVFLQYIPRFTRFIPLSTELKKTAGVFAETAWAGATYYLLLYVLAGHIVGSLWYLMAIERQGTCWKHACHEEPNCNIEFLYCGHKHFPDFDKWSKIRSDVLTTKCAINGDNVPFDYGIFTQAISSGVLTFREKIFSKLCYCLWWGIQNLSTLGQGLATTTYPGENLFSIGLAIFGLIMFALLIGNMQTYLQSVTLRLEEMRIKKRDSEEWMHHRLLPHELRQRVRRYDQYKWLETRGVDEENLVQSLPKDLRREIKRHLCLNLVKRVPLFANMDERVLDAICERLKPSLYTEHTYVVREGDPVEEMLFIIRGRLESETTDGGRSGFFNRGLLKDGDFCGEELLTWALDPKASPSLPTSTRTVRALSEVEAFALIADEIKFVASQFRRLHSRQVQHTFRLYSQQWRTWAASFIQTAWRRHKRREDQRRQEEEEEEEEEDEVTTSDEEKRAFIMAESSSNLTSTILASRFATNALRGVHKSRQSRGLGGLVNLPKPSEPDFSLDF